MKNTTTLAVCFTILFLSISCKQKPQIDDYAIEKVNQPLSNDEVVSAFSTLGLSIVRLNCMLPQKTAIHISSEQFVDGKPHGGNTEGTLYLEKGLQKLILFKKEHADKTVEFSLNAKSGSIGCGRAILEVHGARAYGSIDINRLTPDKQPIYVYAANKGGVEGFSSGSVDIEALAAKYDFMLVVYMSIDNK
jgi:hypothetical protein